MNMFIGEHSVTGFVVPVEIEPQRQRAPFYQYFLRIAPADAFVVMNEDPKNRKIHQISGRFK